MITRSSAYIEFSPDGYPSQSTANIGSYLDGYLSRILLKDGGSPHNDHRSSANIQFSLEAT